MKSLQFALTFAAALFLAAPPSAYAEEICNTYTFRYNGYYADCGCWACGGWAYHNCTECVDTETGGSCTITGSRPCGPMHKDTY